MEYTNAAWQNKRAKILRRDKYIDQIEKRKGRMIPADTVHHIFPLEDFPEYALCDWNLISVSSQTHNRLHYRTTRELTKEGRELMERTKKKNGINDVNVVLVIGLPSSGKSTYVRNHIGVDGIAYDLDAIASAFRLRQPHEERNEASRRMANDLLNGFIQNAKEYTKNVWIIRTAPAISEVEDIKPTKIVYLEGQYKSERMHDVDREHRIWMIEQIRTYADAHGVPFVSIPPTKGDSMAARS